MKGMVHTHICKSVIQVPLCLRCLFAKTTPTGLTTFYSLCLDSEEQTAYFDYRPEGLDEGYRTLALSGVNLSGNTLHHVALSVFGDNFAFFLNGQLLFSQTLIAALEDGPGIVFIGRRLGEDTRFEGMYNMCAKNINLINLPENNPSRSAVFGILLQHDPIRCGHCNACNGPSGCTHTTRMSLSTISPLRD